MDNLKKLFLVALVAALVLVACGGGDPETDDDAAPADTPTADAGGGGECSTDYTTTDSGLKIRDIDCGDGDEAQRGDTLEVHYEGRLEDGRKFDASRDHGSTFEFQLGAGMVIAGWDEGLVGMKVGGKRELIIPPELGYGETGSPPAIPPNATLVFEVELVSIK